MFTLTIGASSYAELKQKVAELHSDVNGVELVNRQLNLGEAPTHSAAKLLKNSEFGKLSDNSGTQAADTTTKLESSIDDTPVSHLDKDGRVWDERIDSPLKTKDRFGRWKQKIGVDKTTRIRIIEELKSGVAPTAPEVEPEQVPEPQAHPEPPQSTPAVDTSDAEQAQKIEQEVPVIATSQASENVVNNIVSTNKPDATNVESVNNDLNNNMTVPEIEHMSLEHFQSNFAVVMSELFNAGKISGPKVQQLCEIARVQQAYQIPLDDTSCKAVYNTLVQENLI